MNMLWYNGSTSDILRRSMTHCTIIILAIFSHLEFYKHVYMIKSQKDHDINEL